MISKIMKVASVLVILTLLTGVVYLSRHALGWGMAGDDPRALDSKELLDIVRREAVIESTLFKMSGSCQLVKLTDPAPEKKGIDGIEFKKIPGQYEINLLLKTEYENQPKRDRQLKQLDYLAEQGIFYANNGVVETTDGEREVRQYRLTWQGSLIMGKRGGATSICLAYGRKAYGEIVNIKKLQEKHKEGDIYNVKYTVRLVDIPSWAANNQALKLFDGLGSALKDNINVTKVVRTMDGWQLLKEREPSRAVSAFAGISFPIDTKTVDKEIELPSVDEVNAYISENTRSIDWLVRHEKTCMPFWIQASDDKSTLSNGGFSITYYDQKERRGYEFQQVVNSLHLLAALERTGLAEMEFISQGGNSSDISDDSNMSMQESGVRFRIKRQVVEAIGLRKRGKGCIPYGRQSLEILSIKELIEIDRTSYRFIAKKTVEEVPDWVNKIVKELPVLESLVEHGVFVKGYLFGVSHNNEKYWGIQNTESFFPKINYNSLPSYLEPLLPNTAEVMQAKKISAPVVLVNNSGSEYEPPHSSDERRPTKNPEFKPMSSQRQDKRVQDNTTAQQPSVSETSLYPADNRDVHMISIRRSSGKQGGPRKKVEDIVGRIRLTVSVSDSILVLYARYPTYWDLIVDGSHTIKKIIAIGSLDQQVHITDGTKPEIILISERDLMNNIDIHRYTQFPTSDSKNDLLDIAKITKAVTGRVPTTYQSRNTTSGDGFFITESTPEFRLPIPISPSDYHENSKMIIQTERERYWSDREFSSGKLYTEATVRITDALSAHKNSNIGLCLSRKNGVKDSSYSDTNLMIQGEQSVRKEGDVFGIAADFNIRRIYYHVNGNWITGKPGSGDGIRLERDKFYRICAYASINPGEGSRSRTEWEFSNGAIKYNQNIPSEFTVL
ncbi:MAG: hypothetical protein KZQ89_21070 [Candidatus Thiodiazotropha sp. (ex Lucinoma kastoroae)]|nr:hypothetical protein [Candidatus Thiodiazotropha sp. (ex Lucinoma kastoroae)]